jgi:hypothetical protein
MNGVDRRSVEDMADRVSRAHGATTSFLLEYLYEPQVKDVCEQMGMSNAGRRKVLVRRLLRSQTTAAARRAEAPSRADIRTAKKQPEGSYRR